MAPYDYVVEDWIEDAYPLSGAAFNWDDITDITIHYPWTSQNVEPRWQAAWIRAMQRDYWRNRGHAIGYNAIVFQDGSVWEIRGARRRCAANGSPAVNRLAYAIQVAVRNDEPASPAAIASVRRLVAWIRSRRPQARVNAHMDVRSTSCPGAGLLSQVRDGTFEPVEEGDDMTRLLWKDERYADTFLVFPVVSPLAPVLAERHLRDGAELIVERHSGVLKSLCAMTGITQVTRQGDRALVGVSTLKDGEN